MSRKKSEPKTTYDKLKKLDPNFLDLVQGMGVDELKTQIVGLAKYAGELKEAKAEDMDLAQKKEAVKLANQSYSEPLKANSLKTKFILELLESKGK